MQHPQHRARGIFFELDGLMQTRTPFGGAEGHRPPPSLGGDGAAILREAGFSDGDIEALKPAASRSSKLVPGAGRPEEPIGDTHVDAVDLPTVAAKANVERITTVTPDVALRDEEVARTRVFMGVTSALAGMLAICAPLLSGPPLLRFGVCAACAVVVGASLWFRHAIADSQRYTERRLLVVSYVLMTATGLGVYFVGVFSPAPMAGTLGIYFLSLGSSRLAALSTYIIGALMHAVPAVLIGLGANSAIRACFATPAPPGATSCSPRCSCKWSTFSRPPGALSRRATRMAIEKLHSALVQVQTRRPARRGAPRARSRAAAGLPAATPIGSSGPSASARSSAAAR